MARSGLPSQWVVPAHLAVGVALLAVVRAGRLPEAVRTGLAWASGAVQALAVLWTLPVVAVVLLGPAGWLGRVWSGAPSDARAAVVVDVPWPPDAVAAPVVLVVVAGVLALAVRAQVWRPRARLGALGLLWATALILPAVLEIPYAAGLLVLGVMTGAALYTCRVTASAAQVTALVLALVTAAGLTLVSLASQSATLVVLSALTVLFAAASWRADVAPFTAPAALVYAAALASASGAAADWPPARTLRADRRPVGYAATVLFVLAAWVRLAAWDVGTPEAYTLPVTVPALLLGALRRRRDPQASSWAAYGPGLAATLVPSLVAAWADPHWTRPLLLGLAALLVTLMGARHHLRAPLVLGGAVLALVTLHELAPYVVQVTGALPRWAPPALAGLLLLALGATYEQRIRDVRRVREALGRMN